MINPPGYWGSTLLLPAPVVPDVTRSRAAPEAGPIDRPSADGAADAGDADALLSALDDADCRAVLDAVGDGALSASEVSAACDLPPSTAYRKLGLLTDAGLIEERTRLRRSGRHASEYVRRVEGAVASFDPSGELDIGLRPRESDRSGPDASPAPRASDTSGD